MKARKKYSDESKLAFARKA